MSDYVGLGFIGEGGLVSAKSAEGPRRYRVGVHRVRIRLNVRQAIGPMGPVAGFLGHGRRAVNIGAGVQIDLGLARDKRAVLFDSGLHHHLDLWLADGFEILVSTEGDTNGPAHVPG